MGLPSCSVQLSWKCQMPPVPPPTPGLPRACTPGAVGPRPRIGHQLTIRRDRSGLTDVGRPGNHGVRLADSRMTVRWLCIRLPDEAWLLCAVRRL